MFTTKIGLIHFLKFDFQLFVKTPTRCVASKNKGTKIVPLYFIKKPTPPPQTNPIPSAIPLKIAFMRIVNTQKQAILRPVQLRPKVGRNWNLFINLKKLLI
jgi:hypothetical protein